jgi:1-aminocyclopropane-1-carboxylate deaminase/D-cysteine desulfhydrase-like pyridoxal-dependent ACC family enzyme
MTNLTPVEDHGILVKREDLHRMPNGVNGAKLRACQYLIGNATAKSASWVVSASSLLSPQNPMAATVAADYGLPSTIIVGGTNPESAARYLTTTLALEAGASIAYAKTGYNPTLKYEARQQIAALHDLGENPYWLNYGITPGPEAAEDEIIEFHLTSADQVRNIPEGVKKILLPWGSANTGVGVLWGLDKTGFDGEIELFVIGPDRMEWAQERLELLGSPGILGSCTVHQLHPNFATYGDKMKASLDGIELHPTYEGKIATYLDLIDDSWRHDESSLFWIVGGPLPRRRGLYS